MAHALYGYDGPFKNIHGHTYVLSVTLKGKVLHKLGHPKDGMVIDFTDFKKIVNETVCEIFDHSLVLNANSPHMEIEGLKENFEKLNYVLYQPSCENLLIDFMSRISSALPESVSISNLKLEETPTSYAEWFAGDN
jgi:6-pyruvoyltetrahydropterin/6-carboxytetrahydropterin synthase